MSKESRALTVSRRKPITNGEAETAGRAADPGAALRERVKLERAAAEQACRVEIDQVLAKHGCELRLGVRAGVRPDGVTIHEGTAWIAKIA